MLLFSTRSLRGDFFQLSVKIALLAYAALRLTLVRRIFLSMRMLTLSEAFSVPVLGFVAASGTGKTTLLGRLIPELLIRGVRCAVIKHSHHDFEVDVPGKDSHRLRVAGATQVLLASPYRTFWVEEGNGVSEPRLADLLTRLNKSSIDLILIEGFRGEDIPKIEIHRAMLAAPLICLEDPSVVAVATDEEVSAMPGLPQLPLNEVCAIADFILDWMRN